MSALDDIMDVLLPYQQHWVEDPSRVKVHLKSRRIGITWATAALAVLEASGIAERQGDPAIWRGRTRDWWYMSYAEDDAKEFIPDVEAWARAAGVAVSLDTLRYTGTEADEMFLLPEGQRSISVTSLRLTSGKRISILPALPRKLRGKDGVFCLDEAALFPDLKAALEAAQAFRFWGGSLVFVSTNGEVDGEFNQMVEDIRGDRKGRGSWSLHKTDLYDAVADGVYHRVCMKEGKEWTAEGQETWVDGLLSTDGADTEFLCHPRKSGGQYIHRELIEAAMCSDHRVVKFAAPDGFLMWDERRRDELVERWIGSELSPLLSQLPDSKPHFLGEDFGRSSDMTVFAPGYLAQDLVLEVPFLVELANVPYESQKRVLFRLIDHLPRFSGACLDATGNGHYLAEQALVRYGETLIECVKMNDPWYAEHLPKMRARFQDQDIRIPRDLDVLQDIGRFQVIDGIPKLPKLRTIAKDSKLRKVTRHGDVGVALACLVAAAAKGEISYGYEAVAKRKGLFAIDGII